MDDVVRDFFMIVAQTEVQGFFQFLDVFVLFQEPLRPEHIQFVVNVLHNLLQFVVLSLHFVYSNIAYRKIINQTFFD